MTDNYNFTLKYHEAVRLLHLLEMSSGVYTCKVDEESYQSEMVHFMNILEEYLIRRRELVQDANKDFWEV